MLKILRRFKFSYALYNFFHKDALMHNEKVYKKLGLHKKYYSSISSKDFIHFEGGKQENYVVSASDIKSTQLFQHIDAASQQSLLDFEENGFAVLKSYVSQQICDEINSAIEEGVKKGQYHFINEGKIMFAFRSIKALSDIGLHTELIELLSVFMHGKAQLFQSINFVMGSEQHTHSDSIHMTTYPLGGLMGVWIALEDIGEDNGPLHYYPGSHKLPYYLNKDYDNEGNSWMLGSKSYQAYEDMIEEKIKEKGLQKKTFLAKKGDVLLWHANLFHGGNEHLNKNRSRKSVVFHYFKEGSVCYHEISQRPALFK